MMQSWTFFVIEILKSYDVLLSIYVYCNAVLLTMRQHRIKQPLIRKLLLGTNIMCWPLPKVNNCIHVKYII